MTLEPIRTLPLSGRVLLFFTHPAGGRFLTRFLPFS
jgi:hypothetical protein